MASLHRLLPLSILINLILIIFFFYLSSSSPVNNPAELDSSVSNRVQEPGAQSAGDWVKGILEVPKKKIGDLLSRPAGYTSDYKFESPWMTGEEPGHEGKAKLSKQMIDERFCRVCRNETLCAELGEHNILSSVLHPSSSLRLLPFLLKLLHGQPIKVGVVGGSVSGGHGLWDGDNRISGKNMHRRIFENLIGHAPNKRISVSYYSSDFPSPSSQPAGVPQAESDAFVGDELDIAPEKNIEENVSKSSVATSRDASYQVRPTSEEGHVFVNDAQGGMGSVYWSYCYGRSIDLRLERAIREANSGRWGFLVR